MLKPTFLIIASDGINCENETALALHHAMIDSKISTISDLIKNPKSILNYQGIVIPGGFSFADHLGSGHVMANKIKTFLNEELQEFRERKRPILGICNGFQILSKLDLFGCSSLRLAHNESGKFIDQWQDLKVNKENSSPWLTKWQKLNHFKLPIRHGEGRVVFLDDFFSQEIEGQIALTYEKNPNGAMLNIAGITDKSGLILGMMPHPEAAAFKATDMNNFNEGLVPNVGLDLFISINDFLKNS